MEIDFIRSKLQEIRDLGEKSMHTSIGQVALLALGAVATLVEAGSQQNSHGPRRLAQPRHQNLKKALTSQAEPAGLQKRQAFSGKGSFYNPETGNQGACGGYIKTNDWVVALNTEQFDGVRLAPMVQDIGKI